MFFSSRLVSIILLLLVVSYGLIKALPLIRGPRIAISDISATTTGLTNISGRAVHTESLAMDGGPLLIDNDGNFQAHLMLPRGSAILRLTATDRFGRTEMLERTVISP